MVIQQLTTESEKQGLVVTTQALINVNIEDRVLFHPTCDIGTSLNQASSLAVGCVHTPRNHEGDAKCPKL
jgi:hypothetical protein